jgi:hypothetical protein
LRGGRERRLSFLDPAEQDPETASGEPRVLEAKSATTARQRPVALEARSTPAEREAHAAFVLGLGKEPVWKALLTQ